MQEIGLDELKSIQKQILKSVHTFCTNNNIHYSLAYGTLIGAIRHNGYIPWDDDIDIMMPRNDYERFLAIYNNEDNKPYMAIHRGNSKKYGLPFAKVTDSRTVMNEYMYEEDVFGVYIDLFPVDDYGKSWQTKAIKYLHRFVNAKKSVYSAKRGFLKSTIVMAGKLILKPIKLNTLLALIDRISIMYNDENATKSCIFYFSSYSKGIVEKGVFNDYIDVEFEGSKYRSIKNYDTYLKSVYGDYMQLPPVEDRVSTHTFKAWWK